MDHPDHCCYIRMYSDHCLMVIFIFAELVHQGSYCDHQDYLCDHLSHADLDHPDHCCNIDHSLKVIFITWITKAPFVTTRAPEMCPKMTKINETSHSLDIPF